MHEELLFLGNINKENILEILPDPLKIVSGVSVFIIVDYPLSTIGPYYEMFILVPVKIKKEYEAELKSGNFVPYIYVTLDTALLLEERFGDFQRRWLHLV